MSIRLFKFDLDLETKAIVVSRPEEEIFPLVSHFYFYLGLEWNIYHFTYEEPKKDSPNVERTLFQIKFDYKYLIICIVSSSKTLFPFPWTEHILSVLLYHSIASSTGADELKIVITLFETCCLLKLQPLSLTFSNLKSTNVQLASTGISRSNPLVKDCNWILYVFFNIYFSRKRKQELNLMVNGVTEVILTTDIDSDKLLLEGLSSNFFAITKNNTILTAPTHLVLPGTTQKAIIDICFKNSISVSFDGCFAHTLNSACVGAFISSK